MIKPLLVDQGTIFANGAASAAFAWVVQAVGQSISKDYYSRNQYPGESYDDFMRRTGRAYQVAYEDTSQYIAENKNSINTGDKAYEWLDKNSSEYTVDEAKLIFGKEAAGALPERCSYTAQCVDILRNSNASEWADTLRPSLGVDIGPVDLEINDPATYIIKETIITNICMSANAAACNFSPGPGQGWNDRPSPWPNN